ncbi:hypothetical protein ABEB36_009781 [Hypothenemus hampei]|uniref:Uncharacterized protein n=1 Tax=Hypothenemus hampei TaxID=57062 RepID=A0ABD1EHF8_HYPHA
MSDCENDNEYFNENAPVQEFDEVPDKKQIRQRQRSVGFKMLKWLNSRYLQKDRVEKTEDEENLTKEPPLRVLLLKARIKMKIHNKLEHFLGKRDIKGKITKPKHFCRKVGKVLIAEEQNFVEEN